MLIAILGPVLLFVFMYTGFAVFRYRAQGKQFAWVVWLREHLPHRNKP